MSQFEGSTVRSLSTAWPLEEETATVFIGTTVSQALQWDVARSCAKRGVLLKSAALVAGWGESKYLRECCGSRL